MWTLEFPTPRIASFHLNPCIGAVSLILLLVPHHAISSGSSPDSELVVRLGTTSTGAPIPVPNITSRNRATSTEMPTSLPDLVSRDEVSPGVPTSVPDLVSRDEMSPGVPKFVPDLVSRDEMSPGVPKSVPDLVSRDEMTSPEVPTSVPDVLRRDDITSPGVPTSVPDLLSRDEMTSPGVPTSVPDLLRRDEITSPGVPTSVPDLASRDEMSPGVPKSVPDLVSRDEMSPGVPTSVPDLLSRDEMTSPGVPTSVPDVLSRDEMTSPGVPKSVPDLLSRDEMTSPGVPKSVPDLMSRNEMTSPGVPKYVPDLMSRDEMTSPGMPTSVPDLVSRDDMTSPGVPTSIPDLLSRGERTSPGVPTYFPDLVSQDDMTSPGMPTSVPDLLSRDDMTSPGVPTSVPDLLSRDDMTSPGVPTSVPDLLSRGEMTSPGVPTSVPDLVSRDEMTSPGVPTSVPDIEDDMTKYGDVCYSKDCKTLASHMLSMMDHSANPCDDFYQYACGGLRLRSRMVEVKPADDVWNRLKAVINDPEESSRASQQLIQFYNSCMTYEDSVNEAQRIQKAKHLLAEMTGNPQESNITQLLVKLLNENKTPLFDVLLDIDGRNSSRFALKLVTPVHRSVFERPVDDCLQCSHINKLKYLDTMEEALKSLYPNYTKQYVNEILSIVDNNVIKIIQKYTPFEAEVRRTLLSKEYVIMTVEELQINFSLIEWNYLFSSLLNINVSNYTQIQVYFKCYFDSIFYHLRITDSSVLYRSLLAIYVRDIYQDLVKPRGPCGREQYCLQVAEALLGDVTSSMYLATFTEEELDKKQKNMKMIFKKVQDAMANQIDRSSWIDDPSRGAVLMKLKSLKVAESPRAVFLDPVSTFLSDRIQGNELNALDYFNNSVHLLRRYRQLMFAMYDKNPLLPEQIWTYFARPYSSNVITIHGSNQIVIPLGTTPAEAKERIHPKYRLMASLGTAVALLVAHHFDFIGIHYGEGGNKEGILTDYSSSGYMSEFENCARKISHTLPEIVKHRFDASLSANHHKMDLTALELVLEAYTAWRNGSSEYEERLPWLDMDHAQLFFMSLAQFSCTKTTKWELPESLLKDMQFPSSIRLNNLFAKSEDFIYAFSCKNGTNMNREEEECLISYTES